MILDTNGDMFPEGTYIFRVAEVPEEVDIKGYTGWQFSFDAETEEGQPIYNERFMVWLLAPLMRGLGFKELAPGKFDWEPAAAVNRKFSASIKHVTINKGASAGKTVARMVDIAPSNAAAPSVRAAATAAQAPTRKNQEDIPF